MTLSMTFQDINGSKTFQVFQNSSKSIIVKHYSANRGGCLYAGSIRITNKETGKEVEFDTSSEPYIEGDNDHLNYLVSLVKKHTS